MSFRESQYDVWPSHMPTIVSLILKALWLRFLYRVISVG